MTNLKKKKKNLTPRIPNSCCSSQKASHLDISGTNRGIIDPLVSNNRKKFWIRKLKIFCQKWSVMVQNGPKWWKIIKIVKMVNNGQKRQQMVKIAKKIVKMVQNGPNGQEWSKMVKNSGPDLKQARPTGLSARRTKLGPRGPLDF